MISTMPNQHVTLSPDEEKKFQFWYKTWARKSNINPNPDDPLHYYDYRAAYKAGIKPQIDPTDKKYHWDSRFKDDEHPNRFVNGEDTKTGEPESTEDYYKKYTEDFQKWNKLPTKGKSWINYLPEEIVKGSPFIQKMMAISGSPTAQAVGRAYQPVQENISPEKIVSGLGNQVRSFTEGIAGTLTPQKIGEMLKQNEQEKDNVRTFLDIVESGGTVPMPPKEENVGIIKKAGEIVGGLGRFAKESVSYIPELLADFTSNPLKTIEERPLDILFMVEGSAGPRLRAKARAIKTKLSAKGFEAVKPEIENIVKEFQGEYAPEAETGMTYGPGGEQIGRNVPIPPTYKATPPSVVEGAEGTLGPVRPRTLTEIQSRKVPGLTTEQTGEGGWSPEALSRQKGYAYSIYDTKTGKIRPLPGVDAIDYQPKSFEIKIQENKITGKKEVIDQGTGAQGRRVPGLTIEQRPQITPSTQEMYAEPLPGSEEWMAEALKNAKPREGFESAIPVEGKLGRTVEQPSPPIEKTPMLTRDKNYARPIPGALITVVDDAGRPILNSKGQPMSISEYGRLKRTQQNIKTAEDLVVATTGARMKEPGRTTPSSEPTLPLTKEQLISKELEKQIRKTSAKSSEQEMIISQERGRRMSEFETNAEKNNWTGQKYAEELNKALSGSIKRLQFEPIEKKFLPDAIDGMFDMIRTSPALTEWEHPSTNAGLWKILRGEMPEPAQLLKLQDVFGSDVVKAIMDKRGFWKKAVDMLYDTGNIPRSLMASFDLSAPFRQGVLLVTKPTIFFPAIAKQLKYFASPEAYEESIAAIRARPTYKSMRRGDVVFTNMGKASAGREETFISTLADKIPGVKASNRAYSGYLNQLRADYFDYMFNRALKRFERNPDKYANPEHNVLLLKAMGKLVNSATGRGSIKGFEKWGKPLNAFFFSPRLLASRINFMNPAYYESLKVPGVRKPGFVGKIKPDRFVEAEALKLAGEGLATGSAVLGLAKLAGADVDLNPTHSDFAKIKIGNTRIDIMGGFAQYWRFVAGMGEYMYKEIDKDILGNENQKIKRTGDAIITRFIESKSAPAASLVWDFFKGKGYIDKDFNLPKEVIERLIPMLFMDAKDLIQENPELAPLIIPSILGVGIDTYESKPKKKKIY